MNNMTTPVLDESPNTLRTAFVTDVSLSEGFVSFDGASYLLALCIANRDESRLLIRNHLFTPRMGDVILLSPYDYHRFIPRGEGFAALCLSFPPHVAEGLLFHATGRLSVGKHLFCLRSAAKYLSLSKEKLLALSEEDLVSLLREAEESSADVAAYLDEEPLPLLLRKSLSYLNCHYNEKVSGVFLANRYGVSPKTIDNLFHEYIGARVGEIAERLRFIKAVELTACGIEPEAICTAIGVKDPKALSALIKKYQK